MMNEEDEAFNEIERQAKQRKESVRAQLDKLESQEPVAYLVLFEGAGQLLEFKKGNYLHGAKVEHIPLYMKPQGWRDNVAQAYLKGFDEASSQHGCAECGANGGHALYCVACAEKFVGGYKENVPVHTSELLTQVSTDTQYAGNGTAGIQNETKPTGFFFQMPQQRTWVGLTNEESEHIAGMPVDAFTRVLMTEAKLKEKNT
jgi:hypothetical protein